MKVYIALYVSAYVLCMKIQRLDGTNGNNYMDLSRKRDADDPEKRDVAVSSQLDADMIQRRMDRIGSHQSRARTTQNRFQAALLRARLRQITNQGLTPKQLETEQSSSTDVSNYAASQVHYLSRTVSRMTATVRKMGLKVEGLEKWKKSSEDRMARMEKIVQRLSESPKTSDLETDQQGSHGVELKAECPLMAKCMSRVEELQYAVHRLNESVQNFRNPDKNDKSATSDHQTAEVGVKPSQRWDQKQQADSSVSTGDLEKILRRTVVNDAAITNLSQAVSRQDDIIQNQKSTIAKLEERLLQHTETILAVNQKNMEQDITVNNFTSQQLDGKANGMTTMASPLDTATKIVPPATINTAEGVLQSVEDMNETLYKHENIINRLYSRVGSTQRCCRMIGLLTRRIAVMEKRTKESRTRADNALKGLRVEKGRADSISTKVGAQKTLIRRIEFDMEDADRRAAQSSERLIELMESHQEAMNATISTMYQTHWAILEDTYSSRIEQVEANLLRNAEELRSLSQNTELYFERLNTTESRLHGMNSVHSDHRKLLNKNITNLIHRISRKEKELQQLVTRVENIKMEVAEHKENTKNSKSTMHQSIQSLREDIHTTSTNLRIDANNQLRIHHTNVTEKLVKLNKKVAELSTTSLFINRQLEEFRFRMDGAQTLDEMRENDIDVLKGKVDLNDAYVKKGLNSLRQDIAVCKSSLDSCCDVTIDVVASLNVTFETYRTNQGRKTADIEVSSERQEQLLLELKEMTTNVETRQNKVLAEVGQLSDTMETKLANLLRDVATNEEQIANSNYVFQEFKNNTKMNVVSIFKSLQATQEKMESTIAEIQNSLTKTQEDMEIGKQNLTQLGTLKERINRIEETVTAQAEDQESIHSNCKDVEELTALNKIEIDELIKTTKKTHLRLQNSIITEAQRVHNLTILMKHKNKHILTKVEETEGKLEMAYGARLRSLEAANSSIHSIIGSCAQDMLTLKDGLKELHKADNIVSSSLMLHQKAITDHDHLHRNLTVISDEIRMAMNEQGIALGTIHEVMRNLNESFVEGRDVIDESFTAKLQGQKEELKAVRAAMGNFSKLISKVMNDQLQHDISHTTILNTQRSLMESHDLHDSMISEITSTVTDNTKEVEKLHVTCNSNSNQLMDIVSDLENHERRLRVLDTTGMDLAEANTSLSDMLKNGLAKVNTSMRTMHEKLANFSVKLTSVERNRSLQQEIQEKFNRHYANQVDKLELDVEENFETITDMTTRNEKTQLQIDALFASTQETSGSINGHELQMENIEKGISLLAEKLSNHSQTISRVNEDIGTLQSGLNNMEEDITALNASRSISLVPAGLLESDGAKPCPCNAEIIQEHENKLLDLSKQTSEFTKNAESITIDLAKVSEMLPQVIRGKERVATALSKLAEHDVTLESLNASAVTWTARLENLRKTAMAQSSSLQSMHNSNIDVMTLVQNMQNEVLEQAAKFETLRLETREVENKLDTLVESATESNIAVNKNMEKVLEQALRLSNNTSEVENRLAYLEYDTETIYNSTQLVFRMLDEQALTISTFSGESNALITSIVSSMDSLDSSFQDMNSTLSFEVNDIKDWLNDFQDAFDTSNRQMGRYSEEVKIMTANATQQFNHFSTSIDFLTQIVRESNEAVSENTERIDLMNETMILVQLSVPMLLAAGLDGGLFDATNETKERMLFAPEDLTPNVRRRGDRRDSPQDGPFVSEYGGDDYDLDAILNGDADDARVRNQMNAWITNNPYTMQGEDYLENYDFESLERRKRIVKDVHRVDTEILTMKTIIERLKTKIDGIENKTFVAETGESLTGPNDEKIAFSAGLSKSFSCCGVVKFDKVFSNIGSTYNPSTGLFTASTDGFYMFLATVSYRNIFINAAIYMNGMPQVTVRMDHSTGNLEQSQSTNSVILSLTTGDEVWLETYSGELLGIQYPVVTFSGYRIA